MNKTSCFLTESNWLPLVKSYVALVLFLMAFHSVNAQNAITGGTTLKVLPGTTMLSSETMVINSDAVLNNAGTLVLKKNLVNQNSGVNSLGSGKIVFSGSVAQSISGQNVIQDIEVNNSAGLILSGTNRVNGILNLTNGIMTLGVNNLLLGPAATIAGTPSAASLVDATGDGQLQKEFPAGVPGSFTFPLGNQSGTPGYSPVTLNFTGGTFDAGNHVGVNLKNTAYPDPNITGNFLNRYWNITQSGITNFTCNATFQYLPADVSGNESVISCSRVNPLPWVTYSLTNAVSHTLSAGGIASFGSFTGLKSGMPPENQQLQNITIANSVTNCYSAIQVLTVAGSGTSFLVENGGNVTLVAGNKILMLAGTKVNSGGYLHGFITTSGVYCGETFNPLVANHQNEESLGIETMVKNPFIKVYPNPTTDIVIVELMQPDALTTAKVTVLSMQGTTLMQKDIIDNSRFQFSLSGKPVGIYLVHVQSGDRSEVAKVIKTN